MINECANEVGMIESLTSPIVFFMKRERVASLANKWSLLTES